ncbi:MAG: ABA4-like family protein [Candidatus Poseidoniaceae archaeon]|jgi:hypothetical protein|nr:ABA4-like family protein [Candidatus Poseidoniaceae archaeon]
MATLTEALFWFSSLYILPFWLMMWFFPKHEKTEQMLSNEWIFLAPLLVSYSLAVTPHLPNLLLTLASDMPTPALVIDLFSDDEIILVGWLHYLAFDLLAGRWTWRRLMAAEKPIYISCPILILSMMVAPFGCLLGLLITGTSDLAIE